MSKRDEIQTAINQASLSMNVSEDVAKALKLAGLHPAFATVIMRMHEAQMQAERDMRDMRNNMLKLAQVVGRGADVSVATQAAIEQMAKRMGIEAASLFQPESEEDTPNG